MLWACRLHPRPARTTGCSTWSFSEIPVRSRRFTIRPLLGTHLDHPSVYHRRFRRLTLTSNEAIPVQLDGDPAGFLLPPGDGAAGDGRAGSDHQQEPARGWTIEVIPGAIDILVPCPQTAASSAGPFHRRSGIVGVS